VQPDDQICYCFHVSMRKLVNFARRERPQRASQMSECLGAGSGCGWCIPFLKRIWTDPDAARLDETPEEYAERRGAYITSESPKNRF
jgi:NAD(P)H-nitrite reductase large subunit